MKRVLIAGGGVAALEAALALHDRAGDRVAITIVSPAERFVYRPLSVGEPFALGAAKSVALETIALDLGCEFRRDLVASVDTEAHEAILGGGDRLSYDALLVAMGARRVPAFAHTTTFRGQEDSEAVHGLIQDLEGGYVRSIAFVVPEGTVWSLPIYELALMAAERAFAMSLADVELTVVTPEEEPLAIFGHDASAAVRQALDDAGISIETSTAADVADSRTVTLRPGGRVVDYDRVVALPRIEAIPIAGVPADADGFIPTDAHGRVSGAPDLFAAGDGTWFPVKQGGIACQQADAAAETIAREAGADLEPRPFRPVLRGELLTGGRPLYIRSDISGRAGDNSETSAHTLWWPPAKIAGDYLAPYLVSRQEEDLAARVAPGARRVALIAHPSQPGHGVELLGFDLQEQGRKP